MAKQRLKNILVQLRRQMPCPEALTNDKTNLENAIKHDIINKHGNVAGQGEVRTEGHKILRIDKKDRKTIVYLVSNYAQYGFQNGIFTIECGAFGGKSVMIYSKNSRGEYVLDEYKKPVIPSGQDAKKMFPIDVQNYKITSQDERQLTLQQEAYARAYLRSIGRKAVIQSSTLDTKHINVNVEASNRLWDIDMYSEYPNWIGTLERLENGQRYVYETKFKDKGNGNGIVSFIKRKYGGRVVKKSIISVDGKNVVNKTNLEDSIKHDIIERNTNLYKDDRCDVEAEGHKILGINKKDRKTIVYMIASYGEYSLENGVFKLLCGNGAIPTVMTYKKNKNGEYILKNYKEPGDGTLYVPSIRKMFPSEFQEKAINSHEYYSELKKQEKKYLKEYLESKGINKPVKVDN